jgi:hypothetical protein
MNQKILIILLALVVPAVVLAQINWTKHTINANYDGAYSVFAIDLDDDGDIDVLGAASIADYITWWENDGSENFTEHTIAANFDGAWFVYAIDMEPDGDIDVVGAASSADDITWWENDGSENFTEHTIAADFDYAISVYAIDMEPDGDVDVLGTAYTADDITWWENDGDENFTEHTIAGTFDGAIYVYAIDLDDDNDVDVLGCARAGHIVAWWENDGDENFTQHNIAAGYTGAWPIYAIDVNNDNDIDVVTGAFEADDITWWENDGSENFTEHTIDGSFDGPVGIYAIDLDGDNDIDVLSAALNADDITWWESDLAEILDAGTVSIDIPSTLPADTTLNPQATVKNFGSDSASFDVTCEIDPGAYTSTETVTNLAPADSIQVTLPDGFMFVSGFYTVTVYTQLPGDINLANDTLEKVIETVTIDVGTVSIDIPSTLPEDTTLNPQATVKNFGSDSASFDVTCEIDPGAYTSTETVTNLAPDDSIQVTLPDGFMFVSGFYTVTVYTQLPGDDNLANDTLEKVIEATGIAEDYSDTPEVFTFSAQTISNRSVNIELTLPEATQVGLFVYDAVGRLSQTIVSRKFSAGTHTIAVNLNLPAGVYFYNLKTTSGERIIKKFLLVE